MFTQKVISCQVFYITVVLCVIDIEFLCAKYLYFRLCAAAIAAAAERFDGDIWGDLHTPQIFKVF